MFQNWFILTAHYFPAQSFEFKLFFNLFLWNFFLTLMFRWVIQYQLRFYTNERSQFLPLCVSSSNFFPIFHACLYFPVYLDMKYTGKNNQKVKMIFFTAYGVTGIIKDHHSFSYLSVYRQFFASKKHLHFYCSLVLLFTILITPFFFFTILLTYLSYSSVFYCLPKFVR